VLVFEEGYVRPNWVTLDRGGVNAHSSLPRDPQWYRAVDRHLPRYGEGRPAPSKLVRRAAYDMASHLTNGLMNPFFFRAYRNHRPEGAVVEYAGWIRRFSRLSSRTAADARVISAAIESRHPYFFLPLQLNSDAQIRTHSRFGSMAEVIEGVMTSFSRHAPIEAMLLVKNHPLDTDLVPYERIIRSLERELDLTGRVHFLESGHLPTLLEHSSGVVTVNSTTGMSSLVHKRPTLALGGAIYDLPGLTHQGELHDFWIHPESPDDELFHAFRNVVIHTTQANGNFYEPEGIALILESGRRLLQARSPMADLL
jgi:capsular polysaccharide export protein